MVQAKQRMPTWVLQELKEIRRIATMEQAGFSPNHGLSDKAFTEQIREATRIWRESWILGPLDGVIAWGQGEPGHTIRPPR